MSEIGTFTPSVNRQLAKPVDKLIAVLKEEVQLGNTLGLIGQNSCSFILSENADRQDRLQCLRSVATFLWTTGSPTFM